MYLTTIAATYNSKVAAIVFRRPITIPYNNRSALVSGYYTPGNRPILLYQHLYHRIALQ
jgi:hypothetical protein